MDDALQPRKTSAALYPVRGWDYTQSGAYFVTIVAYRREMLFGQVVDGEIYLSESGQIVNDEWLASAEIRQEIQLDAFVVMPNHIHGIVWIIADDNIVGAHGRAPLQCTTSRLWRSPKSLGSFIAGYKSAVTKRINRIRKTPGAPVWQRNYYEHIVRNEDELRRIREYIRLNPLKWGLDRENPHRTGRNPEEDWLYEPQR